MPRADHAHRMRVLCKVQLHGHVMYFLFSIHTEVHPSKSVRDSSAITSQAHACRKPWQQDLRQCTWAWLWPLSSWQHAASWLSQSLCGSQPRMVSFMFSEGSDNDSTCQFRLKSTCLFSSWGQSGRVGHGLRLSGRSSGRGLGPYQPSEGRTVRSLL